MTWYIVASLAWTCPGGLLSGLIPQVLRPIVCTAQISQEAYEKRERALNRVNEIGQDASVTMTMVRGLRLREQPLIWVAALDN